MTTIFEVHATTPAYTKREIWSSRERALASMERWIAADAEAVTVLKRITRDNRNIALTIKSA